MEWYDYVQILKEYLKTKHPTRMFSTVKCTWNVGKGCSHNCLYCNVRNIFVPKLQKNPKTAKYRDGFAFKLFENELKKPSYKKSGVGFIFIWYMGDWMCPEVPDEWILRILDVVRKDESNEFLSCTKNPARYLDFVDEFPENLWLGTTIETNLPIANRFTRAPTVRDRYNAMKELDWEKKFLSIEPKMDCEPETFLKWVKEMDVKVCEVGADNYRVVKLPEPEPWKVRKLLDGLNEIVPLVVQKRGLERLLNERGETD